MRKQPRPRQEAEDGEPYETGVMKTYYLRRLEDVSGSSGCGRVAQVAEFDDGAAVLHWNRGANRSGISSTEVFSSIEDLLRVHGHNGRSILEPTSERKSPQESHSAQLGVSASER